MGARIELGDVLIDVVRKDIKNIHLSVHPPDGTVRISAPLRMDPNAVRAFAVSKLGWVRRQRRKFQEQEREPLRDYLNRESHYVWGKRHLLKVMERDGAPKIELRHESLLLSVRPGTDMARRQDLVAQWYRTQLREAVPPLLQKWEPWIGVKVKRFHVRHMKTKWGSCNCTAASIRLNTELARKPPECLEYVVVHEMVHLLEPTHGARFVLLMDRFMPQWRDYRGFLNRLPVRHEW